MSDFLKDLMDSDNIPLFEDGENSYAIRVLSKGEDLFFRENDKGLICTIDAVHGVIYKDSINRWDIPDEKMGNEEKERVLNLILKYYKEKINNQASAWQKVQGNWQKVLD